MEGGVGYMEMGKVINGQCESYVLCIVRVTFISFYAFLTRTVSLFKIHDQIYYLPSYVLVQILPDYL